MALLLDYTGLTTQPTTEDAMRNNINKPNGLHSGYKRTLEISFIVALLILCSLFFAFQKYESRFELPDVDLRDVVITVIPPTKHRPPKPPRPPKPNVFVQDNDAEELAEDEIIELSKWDPSAEMGPPPQEQIEHVFHTWELSKLPEIKFQALPHYPEIARKAGIEGRVTVEVVISKKGDVISATILKGIPMLNDAALEAAKKCTFSPAMQRDKYVRVRMYIPFDFRLR
jgi:protein TonB